MDDKNQKETVQGYEIKQYTVFKDNRGFALAESPTAPDPFVTWQFTQDENGTKDYYWGHYFSEEYSATKDFVNRVTDYMNNFEGAEHKTYRYYSTQRPIDIGTFPKPDGDPLSIVCFNTRTPVENGNFVAWGYIEYAKPLTEKQASDYELRAAPANADVRAAMREQAQVVGHWEEMKCLPDNERFTWHKPSINAFELRVPVVTPEQMAERFRRAKHELTRAERQTTQKPIMEQLAEAAKQVERGGDPAVGKKKTIEERLDYI